MAGQTVINEYTVNEAQSEYKHLLTFRVRCCHSSETRAPITNPPNCGQLDGSHGTGTVTNNLDVWK